QLIAGCATGDTASYVRALERRVARGQGDGDTLTLLGLAYQQRARETGDPAFYRLSARALARASAAHGQLSLIRQARASLLNTQHRFAAGLAEARRAIRLDRLNG